MKRQVNKKRALSGARFCRRWNRKTQPEGLGRKDSVGEIPIHVSGKCHGTDENRPPDKAENRHTLSPSQ